MLRSLFSRVGAIAVVAAALAACSADKGSGTSGTGGGTDGGSTSSGATALCATDPRAMPYAVGLAASSTDGATKVSFVDASPAPPSRGENTWTIKLTDASGAAMNGASIAVKTFMPDHGHGSSITPQVKALSDGTYEVDLLELFMPGIWQITFTVTPATGIAESVMFTFCVDG